MHRADLVDVQTNAFRAPVSFVACRKCQSHTMNQPLKDPTLLRTKSPHDVCSASTTHKTGPTYPQNMRANNNMRRKA